MKKVHLFPHNEVGHEKLCEVLKNNKCATLNHATGTGKTFIALKYIYDNKDKKILYLAPTYPIIEQLKSSTYKIDLTPDDLKNVDTMIYRSILDLDMDELYKKYDVIIFDEYHRCGAKETYKKIKQLKLNLQKHDDDKKFIGLTATPIRYLDKERNMTNEIFDGVVASSLSLSQAMLEEILPVPLYINSKIACRQQLHKSARKIKRLEDSKQKKNLENRLKKVSKKIDNGSMDNRKLLNKYITEKDGKYIVFCDSIESLLKYYNEADNWFSGIGKIKKYKVYSGQQDKEEKGKKRTSREVNQANLNAFNDESEGISLLFCVDILNEGVHVDGIDGVIMLRKTMSPIIYFQEIGRALSFSGRKKQIKIFDLVNNFGNHNAIDMLYEEFKEEMKKQIELHPEKAEEYKKILDRFKIMDETKEIISELDEINSKVTYEKIIGSKLDRAITNLEANFGKILNLFENEETRDAYLIIDKYYKYINNEQFKKLQEIDIILPEKLSMTYEERLGYLKGYDSIYEREKAEHQICIDDMCKFISENGRKPDIKSENYEERNLLERYLKCIPYINEDLQYKIKNVIESSNIQYESWEKVLLGERIYGEDLTKIILKANEILQKNQPLPDYLYISINNITLNYNIKENENLFTILSKSDNIDADIKKKYEEERIKQISEIVEYLEQNEELSISELMQTEVKDKIANLPKVDASYIKRKFLNIKKKKYQQIVSGSKENLEWTAFIKKMRKIETGEINNLYESIEQDRQMYGVLKNVVEFMVNNNGILPNKDSDNEIERKLATQIEKYTEDERISKDISIFEKDMQSRWFSTEKVMYSIILEDYEECEIKLAILKHIDFFNKKGRRALKNSQDEEERKIAEEYEKKCISVLPESEIDMLNKVFNKKNNIQKTCEAYINNLIASQEGR